MITRRDQDIINFLEDFHIATSSQIHRLFFNTSYQYSRERLYKLYQDGILKRTQSTIDNCYAYYIDRKPVQIHHDLIRSELYTNIKTKSHLLEWVNEQPIENIRPDALCYIENAGIIFPTMIEIHLSNSFNVDKYRGIDFLALFGVRPRLVICTDRQITVPAVKNLSIKIVGTDMSGLDRII